MYSSFIDLYMCYLWFGFVRPLVISFVRYVFLPFVIQSVISVCSSLFLYLYVVVSCVCPLCRSSCSSSVSYFFMYFVM